MADRDVQAADVLAVDAALQRDTGAGEYGLTRAGFVPKPFARLLAEKLALARQLLGDDLDLGSGSVVRKLLEVAALEDARTWSALTALYDDLFVSTATGASLSRLGEELGLPRPYLAATGAVKLTLKGDVPDDLPIRLERGTRLLTPGRHHAALEEGVTLSLSDRTRVAAVVAVHPGPEHNLDPAQPTQVLSAFNDRDARLTEFLARKAQSEADGAPIDVLIEPAGALTGGEKRWSDARYRELLLAAPRSVWTAEALEMAVSLVPGVRRVQLRDAWGGLDITQSIFGNFNFLERVFAQDRDLASPYYVTILVAPSPAAIWSGTDGLRLAVESAVEDLRPIGILPNVEQAEQVSVGFSARIAVDGLPLPSGSVNESAAAGALKRRLLARVRRYVDGLGFGEPVRAAEVTWTLMSEPGVLDVDALQLLRYPSHIDTLDWGRDVAADEAQPYACGANLTLQANQVPVLREDETLLVIA